MLHGLGAGEEVVGFIKDRRVIGVVQIVNGALVARFFEHQRKGRARAAAKIKPARAGLQLFFQGLEKTVQKVPISGIIGVILMKIVARLFLLRRKVLMFWDEYQIARRTAEEFALTIGAVRIGCIGAEWTVFLFHHKNGEFSMFLYENRKLRTQRFGRSRADSVC